MTTPSLTFPPPRPLAPRHARLGLSLLFLLLGCVEGSGKASEESLSGAAGDAGQSSAEGGSQATAGGAAGTAPDSVSDDIPVIVVDQFGYLPSGEKVAVIRDPVEGFDADAAFTPGASYALVDADTDSVVFEGAPTSWNQGAVHAESGDRAFWFDFSEITAEGNYYVKDVEKGQRSPSFRIASDVYRNVLRHALRTFFYQRAGQAKLAPYADEAWSDEASHLGSLQDPEARRYDAPSDATTERDVRGGWYDAGDFNKYTSWTASYVVQMLRAYQENPGAFGDDFGLPESENGVSDLLDEARFGLEHLGRLQNEDGSLISVVGLDGASPPSAATGPSLWGSPNTSSALAAAAAFAYGAKVLGEVEEGDFADFASTLADRAVRAFTWAEENPAVLFRNNDSAEGTEGLAAGQQEVGDYDRLALRLRAAAYLFGLSGESSYSTLVDELTPEMHMMAWSFAFPFETETQDTLLYYASLPGATEAVSTKIRSVYLASLTGDANLQNHRDEVDPYLAYLKDYVWGSNSTKSHQGNMYRAAITHALDSSLDAELRRVAARYVHYLHGTNPLGLVYLSNMGGEGAERSVREFYHTWFTSGSERWDRVGESTYGPPPGFLTGGPNPDYSVDGCCPSNCGSTQNNALCTSESLSPPAGQPAMKSYKDFNTGWPANSWSVTENSNGYQIAYIRLLSKYVSP